MFQECLDLFQTIYNDVPIFRLAVAIAPLSIFFRISMNLLSCCRSDFIGNSTGIDNLHFEKEVMELPESTEPSRERKNVMICATFPKEESIDYWKCPYCDGLNENTQLTCVHCAAPRTN